MEIKRGLKWNKWRGATEVKGYSWEDKHDPHWPSSGGKGRKGKPIESVRYRKEGKKMGRSIARR